MWGCVDAQNKSPQSPEFAVIWFWAHRLTSTVEALQNALLRMQRPTFANILGPLPKRQTIVAVHPVNISTPPTIAGMEEIKNEERIKNKSVTAHKADH